MATSIVKQQKQSVRKYSKIYKKNKTDGKLQNAEKKYYGSKKSNTNNYTLPSVEELLTQSRKFSYNA